jgi:hypothetical protein
LGSTGVTTVGRVDLGDVYSKLTEGSCKSWLTAIEWTTDNCIQERCQWACHK